MKQLLLALSAPPPPSFDNFVPAANGEVVAALGALLEGTAADRFCYLWGGRGCGKTHLLQAFARAAQERDLSVAVITAGRDPMDVDALVRYAAVAVDDVSRLDDAGQVALFDLVNRMREASGLLLTTGPLPPGRLRLRPELATRLAQGLIYQVRPLTDEDKQEALLAHAAARGFTLGREVAAYLLKTWRRDLPSLMAVLDALDQYSLETKRPVTVPLAREVLSSLIGEK